MDAIQEQLDRLRLGPWAIAGIVLVASLVLAGVADFVVTRVFKRATKRTATDLDDRIIDVLHRPIFLTVLFGGLAVALQVLGLPAGVTRVTLGFLKTLVVLVWMIPAFLLSDLILRSLSHTPDRFRVVDAKTLPLFSNVTKIVLFSFGTYWIIVSWGVNPGAWLASAGIMGIAVGFAAKDTLANLFSGVFIMADSPYKVGDYINLDTGERGEVSHIGIRSTRLITRDDIEITIPNAVIATAKVVNETGGRWPRERIRVQVGVAYGTDIDRAKAVLLGAGGSSEHVCPDPEPRVRFRSFGECGLDLELLCWIDIPERRGLVLDDLNTRVYKALAEAGIEIPYPKRDVYIKALPEGYARAATPGPPPTAMSPGPPPTAAGSPSRLPQSPG
jgi:small-conductance mechanosensitive channel